MTGCDSLVEALRALGVSAVFGMPGTQNVPLVDAIVASPLRFVVPTNESAATFMALGFAAVTNSPGVVTTIPGPGFTYTLSGIAEAQADSIPLVVISLEKPTAHRYALQAIDQASIVSPLVKGVIRCASAETIARSVTEAFELARSGEPGPVYLGVDSAALRSLEGEAATPLLNMGSPGAAVPCEEVISRLLQAKRPLLFIGAGCASSASAVLQLSEALHAPVITTPSGRGIIPEDHPNCLPGDPVHYEIDALHTVINSADCVLAIGCKFSHNSTAGFSLRIPKERLIHVDAAETVVGASLPAALTLVSPASVFLQRALQDRRLTESHGWQNVDFSTLRTGIQERSKNNTFPSLGAHAVHGWLQTQLGLLPRNVRLITDSGLHQTLIRSAALIYRPRGLLFPADFQSMGFAIPAGIGAALAEPATPTVVCVGDGSFLISGMELMTAKREGIALTVLVLNDGGYGLIREQQLRNYGRCAGVDISLPDLEAFATSIGADFERVVEPSELTLLRECSSPGIRVIEVCLSAPEGALRTAARKASIKRAIRRVLAPIRSIIKRR